jgi:predicted MFS family arabinose efflux permease
MSAMSAMARDHGDPRRHMAATKPVVSVDSAGAQPSSRYEFTLVVLLFITWGTVFLDRMSILYLAPFVVPALHLTKAQVGLVASSLAVAWALSGLVVGAISDRIGRRPVLVPAVFAFSILSWISGLVRSFTQLFVVRTLMGAAEGPTWATITATIEESSAPQRRGRNVGVVVSAAALVGMAAAPILTTQIAARIGWRPAFFVAGLPGIMLGLILWKFLREPEENVAVAGHHKPVLSEYLSLLRFRNMWLCCIGSAGFMTWLWVMHTFAPLYITEVTKNTATFAGFILAASGLGAFVWGLILPWMSDRTGRKPALLLVAAISAVVPLTYQMPFLIHHPWLMALAGFVANGGQGIAALTLVIIPTETVSAGFTATAIGLATLVGEIVGGTLAPAISGAIADRYGLGASLWIAAGGAFVVFLAGIFMKETAPARSK